MLPWFKYLSDSSQLLFAGNIKSNKTSLNSLSNDTLGRFLDMTAVHTYGGSLCGSVVKVTDMESNMKSFSSESCYRPNSYCEPVLF